MIRNRVSAHRDRTMTPFVVMARVNEAPTDGQRGNGSAEVETPTARTAVGVGRGPCNGLRARPLSPPRSPLSQTHRCHRTG
jgi:hypothetical protein